MLADLFSHLVIVNKVLKKNQQLAVEQNFKRRASKFARRCIFPASLPLQHQSCVKISGDVILVATLCCSLKHLEPAILKLALSDDFTLESFEKALRFRRHENGSVCDSAAVNRGSIILRAYVTGKRRGETTSETPTTQQYYTAANRMTKPKATLWDEVKFQNVVDRRNLEPLQTYRVATTSCI